MIKRFLRRFPPALAGLWHGLTRDVSFSTQFFGGAIIVMGILCLEPSITIVEVLFLFLSWGLVMVTELLNSAIEAALDQLHPERHIAIQHSKDMAAGAVLIAALMFAAVVITIVLT